MKTWILGAALAVGLVALPARGQDAAALGKGLDAAGRQRMLVQRMCKEVLLVGLRLEPAAHGAAAKEAAQQFERALGALLAGDAAAGIPAAPGDAVRVELEKVEAAWKGGLKGAMDEALKDDAPGRPAVEAVVGHGARLLEAVQAAVTAYEKAAAAGGFQAGRVVTTAGRQRMLSQKVVKEAALVASGIDVAANKEALAATRALFERSLRGLLEGDAEAGLPKAADPAVVERLRAAEAAWRDAATCLDQLQGEATPELVGRLATACERVLAESQTVVAAIAGAGS